MASEDFLLTRRPVDLDKRELQVDSEKTREIYADFLKAISTKLEDPAADRNALCAEVLYQVYFPSQATYEETFEDPSLPLATRTALLNLDPRNITLESEFYKEIDEEKFARTKPLLWLWIMFDRSPLGHNVHLGVLFRRLLARHVFKKCGKILKAFRGVEFSFGYNISVGDNVTLHKYVFIDDRGEVVIGNNGNLSDFVNVYSHSHSINDITQVTCHKTVIEDGARLTYHSTILSGRRVGRECIVGSHAVVTRDVDDYHVAAGIPAQTVKVKEPRDAT